MTPPNRVEITIAHLKEMSKHQLIHCIREMERQLVSVANASYEMSWQGEPRAQQTAFDRNAAYTIALKQLRACAGYPPVEQPVVDVSFTEEEKADIVARIESHGKLN